MQAGDRQKDMTSSILYLYCTRIKYAVLIIKFKGSFLINLHRDEKYKFLFVVFIRYFHSSYLSIPLSQGNSIKRFLPSNIHSTQNTLLYSLLMILIFVFHLKVFLYLTLKINYI